MLPTYSGNFKFLLKSLIGLKTSYSLIIELKLFGIKEDVLDLKGWVSFLIVMQVKIKHNSGTDL